MTCTFNETQNTEFELARAAFSRVSLSCYGPEVLIILDDVVRDVLKILPEELSGVITEGVRDIPENSPEQIMDTDVCYSACAGHWLDTVTFLSLVSVESKNLMFGKLSTEIFKSICVYLHLDHKEFITFIQWRSAKLSD